MQAAAWPKLPHAPDRAPNVLVFLTDDVGFGACSTFGGPIQTPVLDGLAASGLRFTHFHTTAVCSPTRASLLTGRNPHRVAMGTLANRPTGFDGYTTVIPKTAGTLPQILRCNGYATAMFGKGHVTPEWEMSAAGPFDRWPTGLGFEYFYGFLGYDTNMWAPALVENTTFLEPPQQEPPRHFDALMADRAIEWIRQHRAITPDKPFFAYYATGTAHSPHHAPHEWLLKFRGRFDMGWDAMREETFRRQKSTGAIPHDAKLTPRPDGLGSWDALSADQKRLAARLMEAYAAALAHADHQVGRIIEELRRCDVLHNTLIIFIQGDNGGSVEGGFNGQLFAQSLNNRFDEDFNYSLQRIDDIGGPSLYNHFPAAWGWAINTPFQYYKQVASHFGGTRNGMVMSWPARLYDVGSTRSQFHHVSDVLPTVLEAAGIDVPSTLEGLVQDPLDGMSMLYAALQGDAPARRSVQIFECLENFGIYKDGWFAGSRPVNYPWESLNLRKRSDPEARVWELYHVERDFSQSEDLAEVHPGKLALLQQLFWQEARAGNITPIHPPTIGREGRPSLGEHRKRFTYPAYLRRISDDAAPHTAGRSFSITAQLAIPREGGKGVIACHGSRFGGYAFYLLDGKLLFHYNAIDPHRFTIASDAPVPVGKHEVTAKFDIDEPVPGSGGRVILEVDGNVVGSGRVGRTLRVFVYTEGFNVGTDSITPVSNDYSTQQSRCNALISVEVRVE
ncbi:MAG: arylsulfatase [Lautropia sp.]